MASDAVAEAFAQAIGRETHLRDPQRWVWRAAFRIAAGELKDRMSFAPRPSLGRAKGCLVIEPFTVAEKRLQILNGV